MHSYRAHGDMLFTNQIIEGVKKNKDQAGRFLGYTDRPIPDLINKKIDEELDLIKEFLDIEYEYKLFEKENQYYAYLIYTVGSRVEELSKKYMKNTESIRGIIVDKLSVLSLDRIKDYIIGEIQTNTGLYVVKELYPGNGGFSIENQKTILESMNNIKTISINEYYQMQPIKTVAVKLNLSKHQQEYSRCGDCENPCEMKGTSGADYKEYKFLYYQDRKEFHKKIFQNLNKPYEELYYIYKEIAKDTLEKYKTRNIPEEIFYNSITDIEVWANDYKEKNGVYGIKEYEWIEQTLDMKVFKLGRLQFSMADKDKRKKCCSQLGVSSDKCIVIDVHIQKGEPLNFELCQKSYKMAEDFFNVGDLKKQIIFICDSWLLSPDLKELLGETSNILDFQSQYKIIHEDKDNRQMEERVFGKIEDNPQNYVANTTLQRNLKEKLKLGKKFGTAIGIYSP